MISGQYVITCHISSKKSISLSSSAVLDFSIKSNAAWGSTNLSRPPIITINGVLYSLNVYGSFVIAQETVINVLIGILFFRYIQSFFSYSSGLGKRHKESQLPLYSANFSGIKNWINFDSFMTEFMLFYLSMAVLKAGAISIAPLNISGFFKVNRYAVIPPRESPPAKSGVYGYISFTSLTNFSTSAIWLYMLSIQQGLPQDLPNPRQSNPTVVIPLSAKQ